jgi:HAD superfamily hydrolase (TIGR01549 family)
LRAVPARHAAWLVDLDGTLYPATPLRALMALELGVRGWAAIGTLRRFRQEHERLRREGVQAVTTPWDLQVERTAQRLGVDAYRVESHAREWMIERPSRWLRRLRREALLGEIDRFREAGGRTALVSDYPAERKLEALGMRHLFDEVVASGEPGGPRRLKPAPDGLLLAAERLAVPPAACLVIGDRDDADGAAARAAGMEFRRVG